MSDVTEHEEEYEDDGTYKGVTLSVQTTDWPKELAGMVIKDQIVYAKDGVVEIVGGPIWQGISSDD